MPHCAASAQIEIAMTQKPLKPRKCKCGCGASFTPRNSLQIAATPGCALNIARKKRETGERQAAKAVRKATREAKERLKTRSDWMREAQAAVNSFVRERDKDLPCISCGRHHNGQYHAGHYLSRGAHPELALEPRNIHKQCAPCNNHLSGNQINFRKGLIARHGVEIVDWLEGPHDPKRYAIDELKAIRDEFRSLLKEMQKLIDNNHNP